MRDAREVREWPFALAGLTGGLAAGCAFVTVELTARVIAGVPTLPELLQDHVVQSLPGPAFDWTLRHLLNLGKPSLFWGLLLLQIVMGALAGLVVARWRHALETALVLWLFTGFVMLPWAGRKPFESAPVAIATLLAFASYAAALEAFWNPFWMKRSVSPDLATSPRVFARRHLIGGLALFVTSVALAGRVTSTLPTFPFRVVDTLRSFPSRPAHLPSPVTSAEDFYTVSKNLTDPTVNVDSWHLQVDGLVDNPLNLTYQDVLTFPSQEVYRTLECISNEVGGDLISTGQFTGARLSDVLTRAAVHPEAQLLHFTSEDGYTETMPIGKAMDPNTLLAYELDGAPLPHEHGFPLRVLGAGTYGMKNPKWLKRIELLASASEGFWEGQGWSNDATVQTMSRIDVPGPAPVAAGDVDIEGIAFAGDRGVQLVEISTDAGRTWRAAKLTPPLGPLTWVFWHLGVALGKGTHHAQVRATDGTGQVQTSKQSGGYAHGSTGYDEVSIRAQS